jgi:predicted enzyme related to lactoylglutathione lyase
MSPRRTTPWPAGTPCWIDLVTPDLDGARAFYGAVLGWQFGEPDASHGGYCLADVDGALVAGIAPARSGMQPAWTLYLASDDVDATAAAITEAGGQLLGGVLDLGATGRMAVALDPLGAQFAVWEAGDRLGVGLHNEPGGLAWEDLRSTDPDAARAFYATVLGWRYEPLEMAGPDYATIHLGDGPPVGGLGGMMGMDGFPSHWIVYLAVPDTDSAVARTEELGGFVLSPGFDTEFGRMAALTDPYGAAFWVVQLTDQA